MYMQVMQAMWILEKSITGYIRFMISGDPGSWQSRIQTSDALSTMEAESMVAASAATQEAM